MRFSGGGLNSNSLQLRGFILACVLLCVGTEAVKHENFKTCQQSGFCKRNRAYAENAASTDNYKSPYHVVESSVTLTAGVLSGYIIKEVAKAADEPCRLPFNVSFYESGVARVTVDEQRRIDGNIDLRHGSQVEKRRYNEAEKWAIVGGRDTTATISFAEPPSSDGTRVIYGPGDNFEAHIQFAPFAIDFYRDGEIQVRFNRNGYMNMEHWRAKHESPEVSTKGSQEVLQSEEDRSTWWEETFGGNTDSKPRGPEAIALDIEFPGYRHVYGAAEHAGPLSLKETRGGDGAYNEPYRLYNSDVFEYELDSPMTLYGSIPFMQAQKADSAVGILWLNAAETWIDIKKTKVSTGDSPSGARAGLTTTTHWISESGIMDVYVFLGPTPQDVIGAYGELTGYTQLPQQFATAYHQCRWNYVTDQDVRDVDRKFDKHQIPYDVIWLDIEYTDGKKYFTWDGLTFSDPLGMQAQLDEHDRKLVAIIDPHIKNDKDYTVVDEMKAKNLAVLSKDGSIYEGWCWPGSSHWVDCFSPKAREWWSSLFRYDTFVGSSRNMFIWNDMNEPSVFNGPETTMPKDNIHYGNWEHRDVHNVNGMSLINATFQALLARNDEEFKQPRRPFVLTRSFFAGSQRLGAVWTGDNLAEWSHLEASIPMVLSLGISGFPFAGADVGGFFGNPGKELLTRWYQTGAFYPFFRGHAHIDTRRREPYLIGDPYTGIITRALRLRYTLLPVWYTAFHQASVNGAPILRPNYYMFPGDEEGFDLDDQFYVGSSGLLVKPVVKEGQVKQTLYLADRQVYYDYFTYQTHQGPGNVTIAAPLESIPMLMQGGNIICRRDRPRRSSGLMRYDPFTLVVTISSEGHADGTIYLDDGETFDYQDGAFVHRRFRFDQSSSALFSEDLAQRNGKLTKSYVEKMDAVRVDKIIIIGVPTSWKDKGSANIFQNRHEEGGKSRKVTVEFTSAIAGGASWLQILNPAVSIASDWKIVL